MRCTFDYGQVNVHPGAGRAVRGVQQPMVGVGPAGRLAAGVKLTPAVAGLYFVGCRALAGGAVLGVVFAGTVGCQLLRLGRAGAATTSPTCSATRTGSARRHGVEPVVRGGWEARVVGHDAGYGPVVLDGWSGGGGPRRSLPGGPRGRRRPARRDPDRPAVRAAALAHLVVAPLGVADSDAPAGCCTARCGDQPGCTVCAAGRWLAAILVGVPWLLSFAQPTIWPTIGRPWYLAWAGLDCKTSSPHWRR